MHGVRLDSSCFRLKTQQGIREIIDCLSSEASQLYCATHGEFLMIDGSASDEDIKRFDLEYGRFLLERLDRVGVEHRDLKLFDRGFLSRFRDYLYGDWANFYLLDCSISLRRLQPWSNELPSECRIFISCVDAAYWRVFAEDPGLLIRLRSRFQGAVPCRMEDGPSYITVR